MCSGKKRRKKKVSQLVSDRANTPAKKNQAVCKSMYTPEERTRCGKRKKKKERKRRCTSTQIHTHTYAMNEHRTFISLLLLLLVKDSVISLPMVQCSNSSSSLLSSLLVATVGLILDRRRRVRTDDCLMAAYVLLLNMHFEQSCQN